MCFQMLVLKKKKKINFPFLIFKRNSNFLPKKEIVFTMLENVFVTLDFQKNVFSFQKNTCFKASTMITHNIIEVLSHKPGQQMIRGKTG